MLILKTCFSLPPTGSKVLILKLFSPQGVRCLFLKLFSPQGVMCLFLKLVFPTGSKVLILKLVFPTGSASRSEEGDVLAVWGGGAQRAAVGRSLHGLRQGAAPADRRHRLPQRAAASPHGLHHPLHRARAQRRQCPRRRPLGRVPRGNRTPRQVVPHQRLQRQGGGRIDCTEGPGLSAVLRENILRWSDRLYRGPRPTCCFTREYTEVVGSTVQRAQAYLLFYERIY